MIRNKLVILCIFWSITALMSGCALSSGRFTQSAAQPSQAPAQESAVNPAAEESDAQKIIRKVDEVKSPQGDYTLSVEVTSFSKGNESKSATYEVMVKGSDNTIIKTIKPQNERGRVILMKEWNLWAFFPEVRKPLRLSMQERLIGDVSNGDIARANFSGDYDAILAPVEKINGRNYYVLDLFAKSPEVTYGKAVVWADKENYRPLKAHFYSVSGKLLKICSYEGYAAFGERTRPTRLVMEDAVFQSKKSVIVYSNLRFGQLPDKYFTKDYMKKLME